MVNNKLQQRKTKFKNSNHITINSFVDEFYKLLDIGQKFCFILGSGTSKTSGIPSGSELEMVWANEIFLRPDSRNYINDLKADNEIESDYDELKSSYDEAISNNGKMSGKYYFDLYKIYFKNNQVLGYDYLQNLMENATPSIGYRALSLLLTRNNSRSNVVITTNFDTLIEDSLFIYGENKPIVCNHESLAYFASNTNSQRPIIAKVHNGLFFNPKNTPEDTYGLSKEWEETLKCIFSTYIPVVVGYSGSDHSLMSYLENYKITDHNKVGMYWCALGDDLPNDRVLKLVNKFNGRIVKTQGFDETMCSLATYRMKNEMSLLESINAVNKKSDSIKNGIAEQYKDLSEYIKDIDQIDDTYNPSKVLSSNNEKEMLFYYYMSKGFNCRRKKEYSDAIKYANKSIEINPKNYVPYALKAVCYAYNKDFKLAIENLNIVLSLQPDDLKSLYLRGETYYISGNKDLAINDLNKVIELDRYNFKEAYLLRSKIYKETKAYNKAIDDINNYLSIGGQSLEAFAIRENCYFCLNDFEKALNDIDYLISKNENDANLYYNKGIIYDELVMYKEAIDNFTKTISLNGKFADAYCYRAICYHETGEYNKALVDIRKAIELDPKNKLYIDNLHEIEETMQN